MIKNRITHREELAPEYFRLIFQGQQLEPSKSCTDYGIEDGSTAFLAIVIRAGVRVFYSSSIIKLDGSLCY